MRKKREAMCEVDSSNIVRNLVLKKQELVPDHGFSFEYAVNGITLGFWSPHIFGRMS